MSFKQVDSSSSEKSVVNQFDFLSKTTQNINPNKYSNFSVPNLVTVFYPPCSTKKAEILERTLRVKRIDFHDKAPFL